MSSRQTNNKSLESDNLTSRNGPKEVQVNETLLNFRQKLSQGPSMVDFLSLRINIDSGHVETGVDETADTIPYLPQSVYEGQKRKVYFETYGCQMNVSDTEIVWAILKKNGFERTMVIQESNVVLVMTCAIREGAEKKIWKRLEFLKSLKKKKGKKNPMKIGILGCMAERLKTKIIEQEKMVDIVCGPDAYRDLPRLLSLSNKGQTAVNVMLSSDETYADILPIRMDSESKSAFVSIMRGCDNMCTYCIVPFTRGRERSRPVESILEEIRLLSDQGVKEVTLLGQNVNSYRDLTQWDSLGGYELETVAGFSTVYKPKKGGRRFTDLLDKVSLIDPEMRIRFTSPHPKDFPDAVLQLINERPNICKQIHLPAQSGNNEVLERMRRGYTRESYLNLVSHIQRVVPGVYLSSDFIAGFCGETEEAHKDTVSLIREVKYHFNYIYPYSMRQKTRAYHRLTDDVPVDVKARRHTELMETFREIAMKLNTEQIGQIQLVLVQGPSKRSPLDLAGRNDGNTKVIFPQTEIPDLFSTSQHTREIKPGDYVAVQVTGCSSQVLKAIPLYHTTVKHFHSFAGESQLQFVS